MEPLLLNDDHISNNESIFERLRLVRGADGADGAIFESVNRVVKEVREHSGAL